MQRKLNKVVKEAIVWAVIGVLLFLFLSPKLLALNLFELDTSFLLVPSLSMVCLLFSSNVASVVIEQTSKRRTTAKWLRILALSVFAFLLSKNAVDNALAILSESYILLFYVSFSFTGGLLGLSLGSLFNTLKDVDNLVISTMSKWVSEGLQRNFILGFSLTAYLSFVRPSIIELNPYLVIAEWVAITFAIAIMYINVKMVFRELYVESERTEWRKHIQEVERETGADFRQLTFVQEQFVNRGIKEPLLVYLTLHLRDLGDAEQQIIRTMAPLLYYHDKKPSIFALPSVKESFNRKNKKARKKLLEDLMAEIEG